MLDFINTVTDRGTNLAFRLHDKPNNLFVSSALAGHTHIGQSITGLVDGLAVAGETLKARASDLTPTGFAKLASQMEGERIAPSFAVNI